METLRSQTSVAINDAERCQVLADRSNIDDPSLLGHLLHRCFEVQSRRSPKTPAVAAGQQELSYEELNRRANRIAHQLRQNGVSTEVPVGIHVARSLGLPISVLAVLKAGGVCVPLDTTYPSERLAFMLNDTGAPVIICDSVLPPGLGERKSHILMLPEYDPAASGGDITDPDVEVNGDNLAFILYTSGSTGKPKGVLLTHSGLANYNLAAAAMYGVSPADRVLQFSSPSFDIFLEEIFTAWFGGGTLVLRSPEMSYSSAAFVQGIRQKGITVADLPTAFWHEWVSQMENLEDSLPSSVRLVIVGGEKASNAAFLKWSQFARMRGVRWINTYGPTEISIAATAFEPKSASLSTLPIGHPLPNVRTYILDESLKPVGVGVVGELYVGGAGVARGYLNRPDLSRQSFIADPFCHAPGARLYRTGDLARFLPDGNIEFAGRNDNQVKVRGFRVEPGEIEELLLTNPQVGQAAVTVKKRGAENQLVAYVTPARSTPLDKAALLKYLGDRLPSYMVPSSLVTLEFLPKTANGKIDRANLPEPRMGSIGEHCLAADEIEAKLVSLWEELLGVQGIGTDQDFFDIGGHSLLAVRMLYGVERTFGKRLPTSMLFESATIQKLASWLRTQGWTPSWSSIVPVRTSGYKRPFFCVHGVGGNVIGFRALANYFDPERPFYALQPQGLDGKQNCLNTVEEMAEHFISEVRRLQPKGPYYLGGFSFGGVVAYEMARQLSSMGDTVGLLALLDTYATNLEGGMTSFFRALLSARRKELARTVIVSVRRTLTRKLNRVRLPAHILRVHQACDAAANRYALRPYSGRVTLFRAVETSLRSSDDSYDAWSTFAAGGMEVHEIVGNHEGILKEPQVSSLAAQLSAVLDSAEQKSIEIAS
jgi:amino acid adenylation domain-containing protein